MKYYVISDIHGFYDEMKKALEEKGFFEEQEMHKLIICGDLLDRGPKNREVIEFVLQMMKEDRVILIRGNHEDLFEQIIEDLLYDDYEQLEIYKGTSYHVHNGTWRTVRELTGFSHTNALARPKMVASLLKNSDFYKKILPAMKDYYETDSYVFTHGYIPCCATEGKPNYAPHKSYYFNKNWREETQENWKYARWYNGMEFVCKRNLRVLDKTVVCGHYHTSYGHARIDNKCTEDGLDAIFTPFYHDGIIAIDACTRASGIVNCIVVED